MLERGDIVVERLTGKRAIVIRVASPEEVTCRFADGRLEERFAFELHRTTQEMMRDTPALIAVTSGTSTYASS